MNDSESKPHVALRMEQTVTIKTTSFAQQTRPLNRLLSHGSTPNFSNFIRVASIRQHKLLQNLLQRTLTHRQRAETQLLSLLHEPEEYLPRIFHQSNDHVIDENLSINDVSTLLNTHPFIIERLINTLYASNCNDRNEKLLNKYQAQRLTRILNSTIDVRALVFFMMLDEDDNQYVTNHGLVKFYEKYLTCLQTFDEQRLDEIIQAFLIKFHLDQKSRIDFEEFFLIVSKDSTLLESLSQFTVHPTWFVKSLPVKRTKFEKFLSRYSQQQTLYKHRLNYKFSTDYIKDNLSRIVILLIYLLINISLIVYVIIYRLIINKANIYLVIARICGMLLNFNCSFTIVLMLKHTILMIRSKKLMRKLIPVDDHIKFHKFIGRVIVILSIVHTIAHLLNCIKYSNFPWHIFMFTTKANIGWIGGLAPLSGVILCVILAIIVIFSMQWIRRGGHFQIFYWTHLLYLPFYALLIIHAGNFWKWVIVPLSLLFIEKFYSIWARYSSSNGRTFIHSVTVEQSNVISLNIHRPKHFTFKPGDYISINLPNVALYEFHPFTISSAPEERNYIRVHIQAIGNWTKSVYQRFKDLSENGKHDYDVEIYRADLYPEQIFQQDSINNSNDEQHVQSENDSTNMKIKKREPILIDGPYSTCARYVFDCKHVILIGGGIGITPYASVLSSLMAQFHSRRTICKHCSGVNYNRKDFVESHCLQKVDFIWVNRNHKNFEWFIKLLHQFEQEQEYYLKLNKDEKRFLDIHLYFTAIKNDDNIGNVPLDFITKTWAKTAGQDIFTNLKTKTHLGRPKWDELFQSFTTGDNSSTSNDINVFFCGSTSMAKIIRNHCQTYRFRFFEEKF